MPLTSYGLGYLILETKYERLGLLLLGCCPGGVGSNFWTAMLGGDINLSVTMTFFSSVAAFAMTSFWIWMLGSPLVSEDLPIPYIQLTIALFSFAIPIILGMIARKVGYFFRNLKIYFIDCLSTSQSFVKRSGPRSGDPCG